MVDDALGNCEKGSRKKAEGLLPQVHFVPWIVLGWDSVPPARNICIQFIGHVYSHWVLGRSYRTQSG